MSNVLLAYSNRADAATLAPSGNFSSFNLATNMQAQALAQQARTADATMAKTRWRADLGATRSLRCVALANHNITSAGTWRVRLGTAPFDADFVAPAAVDERLSTSGAGYLLTGSNFTAQHSATAGTLYAEFDTAASGTCPVISLDNNGANEQILLYSSGTDLKFKVIDGGVTQCDITLGTIAAGVTYKAAVAWSANDFAGSLSGATVATDASGTLPTPDRMRLKLDQAGNTMGGTLKRATRWTTRLDNTTLQALATSGPDIATVGGYDSGWVNALRLTFQGDEPTTWGSKYNALAVFDAVSARYGTIEINDTANAAGYIAIGRLFMGGGIQPARNMGRESLASGRVDRSTQVEAVSGTLYGSARARQRQEDFELRWLTQTEADRIHEMQDEIGVLGEVVYVPDPADMAHSQRYGGLGLLRELSRIEYPFVNTRAVAVRWREKL